MPFAVLENSTPSSGGFVPLEAIPGDVKEESPQDPVTSVSAEVPPVVSVGTASPREGDQLEPPVEDPTSTPTPVVGIAPAEFSVRIVQR